MALKDCFTNFITIEGLGVSPTSGLYANHLTGVTIASIGATQKRQDETDLADTWSNLYTRACHEFISDVRDKLNDKFHSNKVDLISETSDFTTTENTSSASIAGIKVQFSLSPYKEVNIQRVTFKSIAAYNAGTVTLYIKKDDENGETLWSGDAGAISIGTNTVNVYQDFQEKKLFIGYDPTAARFYKTVDKNYLTYWTKCSPRDDASSHINGGGLSVELSVSCNIERFICARLHPLFKYPLFYKIGQIIALERIQSDRVNKFTLMSREDAEQFYMYHKERYEKEMDSIFRDFKDYNDPDCLVCGKRTWGQVMLP